LELVENKKEAPLGAPYGRGFLKRHKKIPVAKYFYLTTGKLCAT